MIPSATCLNGVSPSESRSATLTELTLNVGVRQSIRCSLVLSAIVTTSKAITTRNSTYEPDRLLNN